MDEFSMSLVARMYATNARIEAMKAANALAVVEQRYPVWNFDDFSAEANILDGIAADLRERAG